jgi:circadian clock protein KaiB
VPSKRKASGARTPSALGKKRGQPKAARARAVSRRAVEYVLRLYVTGMTPKSVRAIVNVKRICEEHLRGRYELDIIDIYQQPKLARGEQIIAVPTLIKKLPKPLRLLIGDMSDDARVLLGLDLVPRRA